MKIKLNILALGLLILGLASCEKHDFFDDNTITGAVGPETYWVINSSMVKAGSNMGFTGQYYSSVKTIDHSEVWYDLWEKEDKMVSCALVKAFKMTISSSMTEQKRVLQTISSYPHSEDLWNDSLSAYMLTAEFPVSNTLAPITWVNPTDTVGFAKNLSFYFPSPDSTRTFQQYFKDSVTALMNPDDSTRNYAAYNEVFGGLGLITDTITPNNRDTIPYLKWMVDSTFDENTYVWKKHFKKYDSIFSTTEFANEFYGLDTTWNRKYNKKTKEWDTILVEVVFNEETQKYDSIYWTSIDSLFRTYPLLDHMEYVYPKIMERVDRLWKDSVSFMNLILGAEGYAVEYKKSYYINAELRVYDDAGTYSKTDSKEITIN